MTCECSDKYCVVHDGSCDCNQSGTLLLYRIDMDDEDGILMCEECANDAFESGVFTLDKVDNYVY